MNISMFIILIFIYENFYKFRAMLFLTNNLTVFLQGNFYILIYRITLYERLRDKYNLKIINRILSKFCNN